MHQTETSVVEDIGDGIGDDVATNLWAPPKRVFLQSLAGQESLMRPMTAGSMALSEVEELSLSACNAAPHSSSSSVERKAQTYQSPLTMLPDRQQEKPWSPISSEGGPRIPTLDEYSGPMLSSDHRSGPLDDQFLAIGPSASPTASDKVRAEKGGCAVM